MSDPSLLHLPQVSFLFHPIKCFFLQSFPFILIEGLRMEGAEDVVHTVKPSEANLIKFWTGRHLPVGLS